MRAVRSCITMIFVFAAGLAIGLVVLGWWLYPVKWENGNMEVVNSAQQEDYLRAAIDSYEVNGDQNLAINRYNSLGAFGPATLTTIQENLDKILIVVAVILSLFLLWLLIAQVVIFPQGYELFQGTAGRMEGPAPEPPAAEQAAAQVS